MRQRDVLGHAGCILTAFSNVYKNHADGEVSKSFYSNEIDI
jgi:hypothetical protein